MGLFDRIIKRTKQTINNAVDGAVDGVVDEVKKSIDDVLNKTVIKKIKDMTEDALREIEKVKDLADMSQKKILEEVKKRTWGKIDELIPNPEEIENEVDNIINDALDEILE